MSFVVLIAYCASSTTALIRRRPRVCGVLQEFEQWPGTMTCHLSAMDSALPKFEILSATEDTGDFRGGMSDDVPK